MNRILSVVSKVVGGLFLFSGGTISVGLLLGMITSQASGGILTLLWLLLVFFGLAPASLGGWLLYMSSKAQQQALRERFFQLLHFNQGKLSVCDFAIATRLEPAIARQQLDHWAREFDASFEVTETGDIQYVFTQIPVALPPSSTRQVVKQFLRHLETIF